MNSATALDLPEVPPTLLVVGGGYIGLELGTVYAALGTEVTVVEMTDGLLPGVDRDLIKPLHKRLKNTLAAIHLQTEVRQLTPTDEGIVARLARSKSDGQSDKPADPFEKTFSRVLVAVGRRPRSDQLGLETTNVQVDRQGFIRVDAQQQTDDPAILAVGDVTGQPMLAHRAMRQAKVAVGALAGEPVALDNRAIPAVVFTDPEVAWCGLMEHEARAAGHQVRVGRFSWKASGRAATLGRQEGLTKLVCEVGSQRVLGMGIVGVGAGELIAEGALAVETAAVARDLADTIHTHPTLSETVMESAEDFLGVSTHQQ